MSQKLFLTSAIAMGVIAPAVAAPTYTSDTFPDDGYMQEDYTYTNAATADNMDDVYEGTVNAVAEYDVIDYILTAGKYLPKDSETITTCPAGSYCAGGETFQYSATADQGITSCPTGYALSADGASSANDCYRTCTTSDVEHSTGVTGGYYYGNNNQCGATGCVNGWHLKSILANYINTEPVEKYYQSNDKEDSGYGHHTGNFDLEAGDFIAVFSDGNMIKGKALTSVTQSDSDVVIGSPDETNIGNNCWCKLTEYITPTSTYPISTSYVFTERGTRSSCANHCVNYGQYGSAFFQLWVNTTVGGLLMCEANTITINWSNADAEDISANNAGTATYGSDVRTPVKAETIKGKTFKGWRFSKPEQTPLP